MTPAAVSPSETSVASTDAQTLGIAQSLVVTRAMVIVRDSSQGRTTDRDIASHINLSLTTVTFLIPLLPTVHEPLSFSFSPIPPSFIYSGGAHLSGSWGDGSVCYYKD